MSDRIRADINNLVDTCHKANKTWWKDLEGQEISRNVGEIIALCHSELSEALEAHRKGLPDEKLPHRSGFEVELADAIIRICDAAGGYGLNLGEAVKEKLDYNRVRADHKVENRKKAGGKKY